MVMASASHKRFYGAIPCIVSVVEQQPHRLCVVGSIPTAWVTEEIFMQGVKRMDKKKFIEAYNGFISGKMSLAKAAKIVGRSVPTIRKYFGMVITGEKLPEDLFIED